MKITVVMATRNGRRFLGEQIDSVHAQTRLPDEWIVIDDASDDGTDEILGDLHRTSPVPVHVVPNRTRLGVVRAFERATFQATGDVIVWCDQDDVWYPHKVATVLACFQADDGVHLVAHDADYCDARLVPTGETIVQRARRHGSRGPERDPDIVHGMATAFTRELWQIAAPIPPATATHHDGWMHWIARSLGVRKIIPDRLAAHRRHGDATTLGRYANGLRHHPARHAVLQAVRTLSTLPSRADRVAREIDVLHAKRDTLARIEASPRWGYAAEVPSFHQALQDVRRESASMEARAQLLATPRAARAAALLTGRHRGALPSWGVALGDLLAPASTPVRARDGDGTAR